MTKRNYYANHTIKKSDSELSHFEKCSISKSYPFHFILIIIFFYSSLTYSQSIERQIFTTAGNTSINSNTISWTIGEPISEFYFSANNHITQGFQQGEFVELILPLDLLDFFAKRLDREKVVLNWETASEINQKGVWIERKKATETNFEKIKWFDAKNEKSNYEMIDENDFFGITYYRLKMVDLSGEFSHSNIRSVAGIPLENFVEIFPNPTDGHFQISINSDARNHFEEIEISILNNTGKLITKTLYQPENQYIDLNISKTQPSGLYWVLIKSNTGYFQVLALNKN